MNISARTPSEVRGKSEICFHCHTALAESSRISLQVDGAERFFCCQGCAVAAESIRAAGLLSYYRQRQSPAPRAELDKERKEKLKLYNHPSLHQRFVVSNAGIAEASLMLAGVSCPACMWLIERRLNTEPGVTLASVNYESERARVCWHESEVELSRVMEVVESLGYGVHPYDTDNARSQRDAQQRDLLKRLGVAGLFGMQAMLLAVAVYLGDWTGISQEHRMFMNWVGGLVTLPVFFYSGAPFLGGAWRALKSAQVTMDVPVSLGLCGALLASLISLASGDGDVYFDSIAMFCFFLLSARFLERRLSGRAVDVADRLSTAIPVLAQRLGETGKSTRVATSELLVGDRVLVPAGETIPADGDVQNGESAVDESLLTGESLPRPVSEGSQVVAGSVNTAQTLTIRVSAIGVNSTVSLLARLMDKASAAKPPLAVWAATLASRFSLFVLLVASATALYWVLRDTSQAWHATIAVLVVSCPCALALAVPSAIANATSALAQRGLLLLSPGGLQGLASIKHVVFDKTGTLTKGELEVVRQLSAPDLDTQWLANAVLSLENGSTHPVAKALQHWAQARSAQVLPLETSLRHQPGQGVEATLSGVKLLLGTYEYLQGQGVRIPESLCINDESTVAFLSYNDCAVASFYCRDLARDSARSTVAALQGRGLSVHLYSGDREQAVRTLADAVAIDDWRSQLNPAHKLELVQTLQKSGPVMMVGDGLNDAASLAGASVSVAMGTGAALALQNSDAVLTRDDLPTLPYALMQAQRAKRIVQQNITWALCYNALAMPLAASGWLQPWMAAIGMSASSLIVVLNATRLQRS